MVPPGIEPGTRGFSVCPTEYEISPVSIDMVELCWVLSKRPKVHFSAILWDNVHFKCHFSFEAFTDFQ